MTNQFTDLKTCAFPLYENTHVIDVAGTLPRMLSTLPSRYHEQIAEYNM